MNVDKNRIANDDAYFRGVVVTKLEGLEKQLERNDEEHDQLFSKVNATGKELEGVKQSATKFGAGAGLGTGMIGAMLKEFITGFFTNN